jgi:hypothetical protein
VTTIYEFAKKQRDSYRSDTIQITEGYEFSQYETLRTIELYDNDRFTTGDKDSLDRDARTIGLEVSDSPQRHRLKVSGMRGSE